MSHAYQERRREQRVHLRIRVHVEGLDADGELFSIDTKTFDVSPSGASLEMPFTLPIGNIVEVTSRRLAFTARAVVRHAYTDRSTKALVVGLEFLDGKQLPGVEW